MKYHIKQIDLNTRKYIFEQERPAEVKVILEAEDLPTNNFHEEIPDSGEKEIPPGFSTETQYLQVAFSTLGKRSGKWTRLWLRAYLENGSVYYRKELSSGNYIARIELKDKAV